MTKWLCHKTSLMVSLDSHCEPSKGNHSMYNFPKVLIREFLYGTSQKTCLLQYTFWVSLFWTIYFICDSEVRFRTHTILFHNLMPSIFFAPLLSPYRTIKSPASDIGEWVQWEKLAQIVEKIAFNQFFILLKTFYSL